MEFQKHKCIAHMSAWTNLCRSMNMTLHIARGMYLLNWSLHFQINSNDNSYGSDCEAPSSWNLTELFIVCSAHLVTRPCVLISHVSYQTAEATWPKQRRNQRLSLPFTCDGISTINTVIKSNGNKKHAAYVVKEPQMLQNKSGESGFCVTQLQC